MILCRNLTAASRVIFTTGIASIYLVKVSMVMNKNLNSPGALGKIPMLSIPQIAKGQERSIGQRGFACFDICYWKNWQFLHFMTTFIMPFLAVGQ
jgi:hypothetical protein